jgi:general nucleoside transport system ATP-binding protein
VATVELRGISKRFGALAALEDVSLTLRGGRVHGVLGENGAGKSTLMNVLYGLIRPDAGEILVEGATAALASPRHAIARGIGMVHQHFMLAGAMSVLDNVILGDRRERVVLDRAAARRKLIELADRVNLPVDPDAPVEALSVGEQQRVEILKALYRDVRVLILDEPTAVLTPGEVEQLLSAMSRLRDAGVAVVFISHKLGEVKRTCDDLTILRRGTVVWSGVATAATAAELAERMVGREVKVVERRERPKPAERPKPGDETAPPVLLLEHVRAEGLADVTLAVANEVVGVAGVDGNGQQELAEVILGLRRVREGKVWIDQRDVTGWGLVERTELGVAHVPNDRKLEGLVVPMSIAENVALKHHARVFSAWGWMSWKRVREKARELVKAFDVRAGSIETPVGTLSGGNQQKVVLGRELGVVEPKLVVAMNPSRGLDIAATNFVYEQLLGLKERGCGVLLISSELDEVMRLSDRVGVMYRGTVKWPAERDVGEIGRLMGGV